MLNNIKLPFNLNLLETLSIAGLIAVLFSAIFKIGYYDGIGLPWLVGTMNSQLILNSSINFLILFIPFLLIGWFLMQIPKKTTHNIILYAIPYLLSTSYFILKKFFPEIIYLIKENISFLKSIKFSIIFFSIYTGVMLHYIYSTKEQITILNSSNDNKYKRLAYLFSLLTAVMLIVTLISSPYALGKYVGENTINNLDQKNKVELADSTESWYIIEVISDKVVIYENKKKIFKIIEIKDIKQINYIDSSKTLS
ncbi:hypothetical protein [Acinetobacter baumannii]|uniref:hypothetical protein n=2 Tax=Acinetobacter baumannii TaxID=470 RepID=UPI00233EA3D2|nr:hypothetical protein [Acinetobacter baumannii]MDC5273830.1 hypothetical protein [Acinetobacter baumannii]MDC5514830.1 hypothetical protein [Acinetobacter baumannii]MDC5616788.1 hypothetical protein [Acinetobacter baumannii]MDC5633507.1 hypothetical protein [Acinetobacter baumannii]